MYAWNSFLRSDTKKKKKETNTREKVVKTKDETRDVSGCCRDVMTPRKGTVDGVMGFSHFHFTLIKV